jgi:hypothetical protein
VCACVRVCVGRDPLLAAPSRPVAEGTAHAVGRDSAFGPWELGGTRCPNRSRRARPRVARTEQRSSPRPRPEDRAVIRSSGRNLQQPQRGDVRWFVTCSAPCQWCMEAAGPGHHHDPGTATDLPAAGLILPVASTLLQGCQVRGPHGRSRREVQPYWPAQAMSLFHSPAPLTLRNATQCMLSFPFAARAQQPAAHCTYANAPSPSRTLQQCTPIPKNKPVGADSAEQRHQPEVVAGKGRGKQARGVACEYVHCACGCVCVRARACV